MKLLKLYSYNNKKQIWRIIPTASDKIVVEERTPDKQVFFSCFHLNNGRKIFSDYQLDEKYWIGIEAIHNDIIFFHKYEKPDMPAHKGIIAVDIHSQQELWRNEEYYFSFIGEEKLFCIRQLFESREYFAVNLLSGELVDEPRIVKHDIEEKKLMTERELNYDSYNFPQKWFANESDSLINDEKLNELLSNEPVVGDIEFITFNESLLISYNVLEKNNLFTNNFKMIDITTGEIKYETTLADHWKTMLSDSFFIKDNYLLLLKGKNSFDVFYLSK
jgi:hypothetical protein